jgi:aromatic ring-opening dioxygenase catalytic subunit (LigB family)
MANARMPSLYIAHGGGPCFFMEPPAEYPHLWDRLATHLKGLAATLPREPKAILAISGHWEEPVVTVNSGPQPPMLFDYYGFPPHTYQLSYPAPGSPDIAARVLEALQAAGIPSGSNAERGFDHGIFVPFLLAFRQARIPVVQLSLHRGLQASDHLAIGQALEGLRDEDILIVGSGMSFHNLRAMFVEDPRLTQSSQTFDHWLAGAATASPAERGSRLADWAAAPYAEFCHPRPEHLLPLMVAAGAGGDDIGIQDYSDLLIGKAVSGFRFG